MMKKQVKLFVSVLMAAVMAFSFAAVAGAEPGAEAVSTAAQGNSRAVQFVAIWDCGRLLSLENSLGKMYCSGYTDTYPDYYAEVIVELQQFDGGWSTIKTWSDAPSSDSATVDEYYYVAHGTYQLKVTHRAYNTDYTLADEFIAYSDTISY